LNEISIEIIALFKRKVYFWRGCHCGNFVIKIQIIFYDTENSGLLQLQCWSTHFISSWRSWPFFSFHLHLPWKPLQIIQIFPRFEVFLLPVRVDVLLGRVSVWQREGYIYLCCCSVRIHQLTLHKVSFSLRKESDVIVYFSKWLHK